MHKKVCLMGLVTLATLSSPVCALDHTPWLGDVYQFCLDTAFIYNHYRTINGALEQPAWAANNYTTPLSLLFTPSQNMGVEIEGELAQTPNQSYGFRSGALALRYRLLDDIAGDVVSWTLGLSSRLVTGRSVRDVNSPYASYWNQELICSVGKEFIKEEDWRLRSYAAVTFGIANKRSLWDRAIASVEGRIAESHILNMFAEGIVGYGGKKYVDINHFHGWGTVHHRSIDIGAQYRYSFFLWGEIGLSYAYRVYAKFYPQNAQTVELSYTLLFSMF